MKSPLVVHVLPVDAFRGAQTYARELRTRLDGEGAQHRSLVLFRSPAGALRPDVAFEVPPGLFRRAGFDPRVVRRLRRFLRNERPAVVVAHGGEPLKYLALAGVTRRRLVYYKIGLGDARLAGAHRALHRWLLGRATVVAAVSDGAAEEARVLGVAVAQVVVIPNGRDVVAYGPREHREEGALPRLVWVGHFDPTKRPDRFVELVQALRTKGVAVGASMAGEGPMLEQLRGPARSAGIDLLGNIADVPGLMRSCDLFVFTGAPPEGMPGVLIEAGLSGLAVVTTDVPGAGDVVDDGRTGCIVPVDDFEALVNATRTLVENAPLRDELGEAGRARCEERFGLDASIRQWQVVLQRLLADLCTSST